MKSNHQYGDIYNKIYDAMVISVAYTANTKICITFLQRRSNIAYMLYKCSMFTGIYM